MPVCTIRLAQVGTQLQKEQVRTALAVSRACNTVIQVTCFPGPITGGVEETSKGEFLPLRELAFLRLMDTGTGPPLRLQPSSGLSGSPGSVFPDAHRPTETLERRAAESGYRQGIPKAVVAGQGPTRQHWTRHPRESMGGPRHGLCEERPDSFSHGRGDGLGQQTEAQVLPGASDKHSSLVYSCSPSGKTQKTESSPVGSSPRSWDGKA